MGKLERDILVIDDDVPTTNLIAEILGDAGYVARIASDTATALAAVQADLPALILLDLAMPGNGQSLLTLLRSGSARGLPIILMSAGTPPPAEVMLGATDFLAKPFDLDELLQCVKRYIGKPVREPGNEPST